MPTRSLASRIIADPDETFLKALNLDPSAKTICPLLNFSESETIQRIETLNGPVSAIFVNPKLGKNLGIPIIRSVHQHRPMSRLY
jgi:hypothetical protein